MKNTINFILVLLMMIFLNSCVSESPDNINEFLEKLNKNYEYNLFAEDFITIKKDCIIYQKYMTNSILLSFYCNDKNEIIASTITASEETNNDFEQLCEAITSCLIKTENQDYNKKDKNIDFNDWNINKVKNDTGTTLIINRTENPINHNEKPKLKEYVNK